MVFSIAAVIVAACGSVSSSKSLCSILCVQVWFGPLMPMKGNLNATASCFHIRLHYCQSVVNNFLLVDVDQKEHVYIQRYCFEINLNKSMVYCACT